MFHCIFLVSISLVKFIDPCKHFRAKLERYEERQAHGELWEQ